MLIVSIAVWAVMENTVELEAGTSVSINISILILLLEYLRSYSPLTLASVPTRRSSYLIVKTHEATIMPGRRSGHLN